MESVQLKIEFENALRRASVARGETLQGLKRTIANLCGVEACDIQYRDEENDLITVGSDAELAELLAESAKSGKILRLIVVRSSNAAPKQESKPTATPAPTIPVAATATPPPPRAPTPEPEVPWIHLSRALSDARVVERIQKALQSPLITDVINRAARAYTETRGNIVMAGLSVSQQIPALLAWLAELMHDLPVLRDLQTFIMNLFMSGSDGGFRMPAFFPPFFGGGGACPTPGPDHHHRHGGHHDHQHPNHHHHHHHHGPHEHHHHGGPQKHFGVFCDGCGSDEELKKTAIAAGHQTRRGFIRGLRYKSQTVDDFDLCESCKASDRFPDRAYGPFTQIQPPTFDQQRGCRGGGRFWGLRQNEQQNWRHCRPEAPATSAPAATATEDATKPIEFDFVDAFRSVIARGSEALKEVSKNPENVGDIARAFAEKLSVSAEPVTKKSKEEPTEKSEEDVPVAQPVVTVELADPFVKWAKELNQLQTLGFDNLETYIDFLEEENGSIEAVVTRIINRDLA